ncbi:MAG: hypothetical protein ABJF10_01745 [Chthoniobacter sp.]|uniref:hypothetical protein n=1 Tax=Chthoniobacter sp. TaxID=2510640 RepID=UPI0032AA73DF
MNKLMTPLLATLLALATQLSAAEPESAFGLAPSATPQLQPAAAPSNLPLIPEAPQPAEKAGKGDEPKGGDKTAMAEDKLKKKIALRQAKMKAERDPALQALKTQALEAPTDFEQRKLYIDYYTALVDRIVKFNPGMTKEEIDMLRGQYTGRFFQVRVEPTVDPATFRTKH